MWISFYINTLYRRRQIHRMKYQSVCYIICHKSIKLCVKFSRLCLWPSLRLLHCQLLPAEGTGVCLLNASFVVINLRKHFDTRGVYIIRGTVRYHLNILKLRYSIWSGVPQGTILSPMWIFFYINIFYQRRQIHRIVCLLVCHESIKFSGLSLWPSLRLL